MKSLALSLLIALAAAGPMVAQDSAAATVGAATAILVTGPEPGMKAIDFTLPWADKAGLGPADDPFSLIALKGQVVVLAFYPRDFTSGCTAEMRTFADKYDLMFTGTVLVGISIDSLETHVRFAESLGLPFKLLSDPKQRLAAKYGAKGSQGSMRRVVYVIGKDGKVAWRDMQFNATDPKGYDRLYGAIAEARGKS
ncbi:MAG: peroxiredoxin [Gemmatimonadales bacterium]|jgi:peroxiredoxin Q/BCP|nr:MAG: peroxiredoxin [Gemmatimonadales bacterium]